MAYCVGRRRISRCVLRPAGKAFAERVAGNPERLRFGAPFFYRTYLNFQLNLHEVVMARRGRRVSSYSSGNPDRPCVRSNSSVLASASAVSGSLITSFTVIPYALSTSSYPACSIQRRTRASSG